MPSNPAQKTGKPRLFYGYVIVAAGFLAMALIWGTALSYGLFVKPMAAELGWSRGETAAAYSLMLFSLGALSMLAGRLNDRFGPRVVIGTGAVFLGASVMLMSRINSLWELYILFGFMMAIGVSTGFVPLGSTVARWFIRRRGLMTGIVLSGFGAASLAGAPLVNWLISAHGWRTTFFVLGLASLVSLGLVSQLLRRDPFKDGQSPYGEGDAKLIGQSAPALELSVKQAMHTRQYWLLLLQNISFGVTQMFVNVHLVPYATDQGVSTYVAASVLAVIGILNTGARVTMGASMDRIGTRRSLIASLVLVLISLALLPLASTAALLFLFAVLFGIGTGGYPAMVSNMVAEFFGMKHHGAILGTTAFAWGTGGALGPLIAGYMFDSTGSYQTAFIIFAGVGLVSLLAGAAMRPGRSKLPDKG